MTTFVVIYSPESLAHLTSLFDYIRIESSAQTAERFVDSVVHQCDRLDIFPDRGVSRDDIRPGLRTLAFRRVLISYVVRRSASDSGTVTITGVFYGGQDYETILGDDDES